MVDRQNFIVFSRDELKQKELKTRFPFIQTRLGDIRDIKSLNRAMTGIDRVFHFAALKQVEVVERHPEEALATNVNGLINSFESASQHRVQEFFFTSTDKAVLPINVYGMSKAFGERYLLNQKYVGRYKYKYEVPEIKIFRWGNILGSRGSVLHSFLKAKEKVQITDVDMIRFWIRTEDAIRFMLKESFDSTEQDNDGVLIPPMKSATILEIAECCAEYMGRPFEYEVVGLRDGEKIIENMKHLNGKNILDSGNAPRFSKEELKELIAETAKAIGL